MPEVRVDLEVLCDCGDELTIRNRHASQIIVQPCEKCQSDQFDVGFAEAKRESMND